MEDDGTIFQDGADKGQVKRTADMKESIVEGPMQKANGLASFLANVVNVVIPRKVVADPDAKEFDRANSFNWLVIHEELHLWVCVSFGGDNHGLGLTGIGSQIIGNEPDVNRINVFLEIRKISSTCDGFIKCGVICIEHQGTALGKRSETKIISVDKEKKGAQDRALRNSSDDRGRVGGNPMDSNNLRTIGEI